MIEKFGKINGCQKVNEDILYIVLAYSNSVISKIICSGNIHEDENVKINSYKKSWFTVFYERRVTCI